MRPKDMARGTAIAAALQDFSANVRVLPGVVSQNALSSLTEQIVESVRRIQYIRLIHRKRLSPARSDPRSEIFDPIMAASLHSRAGDLEEACWLVFLSVHFGRNGVSGWELCRLVYGGLGDGIWTWRRVHGSSREFGLWLQCNQEALRPNGVVRFGNHRKYESIGNGPNGTGSVVESYVQWVNRTGSHDRLFGEALKTGDGPIGAFDILYKSIGAVRRFGRTAKFDYLTMLAKLGLANIEAGIPYLNQATGPLRGARLLFSGSKDARIAYPTLDQWVSELGGHLGVDMQTMEDSLCNWQKHPTVFVPFRG